MRSVKFSILFFHFIVVFNCVGQTSPFWPFGYKHALVFDPSNTTKFDSSSVVRCTNRKEGDGGYAPVSSAIGDCQNQLLFYATDAGVWNNLDSLMENGDIGGGCGSILYGTKSVLIVPHPHKDNLYYLIYTGLKQSPSRDRLMMAYIDMSKNAGKGKVIFKDSLFAGEFPASRNLTYAYHRNGRDIWLITTPDESHVHAFLIDSLGLNRTPIISDVYNEMARYPAPNGYLYSDTNLNDAAGAGIAFTKDQKHLITYGVFKKTTTLGNVLMYNFNDSNGKFAFNKVIFTHSQKPANTFCSAACFSPNDSILYVYFAANDQITPGYYSYLFAVNRYTNIKSQIRRFPYNFKGKSTLGVHSWMTNLTLAPDNRIYSFMGQDIWRIERPNTWGPGCMYRYWDSSKTQMGPNEGLPRVFGKIRSTYFEVPASNGSAACQDSTSLLYKGEGVFDYLIIGWGDSASDTISNKNIAFGKKWKHLYAKDGKYAITVGGPSTDCGGYFTYSDTIEVKRKPWRKSLTIEAKNSGCRVDTLQLQWSYSFANEIQLQTDSKIIGKFYNTDSISDVLFYKEGRQPLVVTATSLNSCRTVDTFWALSKFLSKPSYEVQFDSALCNNEPFNIQLKQTKKSDSLEIELNTLHWTCTTDSFLIKETGFDAGRDTFYIVANYSKICRDTQSYVFIHLEAPSVNITSPDPIEQCSRNSEWNLFFTSAKTTTIVLDSIYWPTRGVVGNVADHYVWQSEVPGDYRISYIQKNSYGCSDSSILDLKVLATPNPRMVADDSLCSNELLHIGLFDTMDLRKGVIYVSDLDTTVINKPQRFENIILDYSKSQGWLGLKYIATAYNNCFTQIEDSVFIKLTPQGEVIISDTLQCLNSNLFQIKDVFSGKTIVFWGDGSVDSNALEHTFRQPGDYTIKVYHKALNGCTDTNQGKAKILNNPKVFFQVIPICKGVLMDWKGSVTKGESPLNESYWIFNGRDTVYGTDVSHAFLDPGRKSIKFVATDIEGCVDSLSQFVRVSDTPIVTISFDPLGSENGFADYHFSAIPDTFWYYEWNVQGQGIYSTNPIKLKFPAVDNSYPISLTVQTIEGCKAVFNDTCHVMGITGFYFPTAITLNGDGINEKFGIAGPEYIKDMELTVFNKWGEKVFETKDPYEMWVPQQELAGMYVFVCKVTDVYNRKKRVNGTVYLIR